MRLLRLVGLLIVLISFGKTIVAQDAIHAYRLGTKTGIGYIVNHAPTMEHITNQHISKIEVFFEKNTFGNRPWQQLYGFPRIGGYFTSFNLQNEGHFGKAFSIAPYLNFRIIGSKAIQLRLKPSIGLGIIEKPFDARENFKNVAIGSRLNIFFSVLAEVEWKLSEEIGVLTAFNFSHFSNTSYQSPNLGINMPTAEIGLFYNFGKKNKKEEVENLNHAPTTAFWRIGAGAGLNAISVEDGNKYLAVAWMTAREKRLSLKSSIGGSFDLFYNPAQRVALQNDSIFIQKGYENLQSGLSFYHVHHFGKLEAVIQAGFYLKTEDEEIGNFYQIVKGRYNLSNRLVGMLIFKTHFAKAEYLMLAIGYKFNNNE